MIRVRHVVAMVAGLTFIGVTTFVGAQAPVASARHVRISPLKVGRLVSEPTVDAPGSFTALRESVRGVEIFGIVQTHTGVLVPNAGTVVIRELFSGTVAATTEVNDLAQFSLRAVPPGTYAAELTNRSGIVIASTPAFSARLGEVIQIAQTIPAAQSQAFIRMARSVTAAALSAAAVSGVLTQRPGAPLTPGS